MKKAFCLFVIIVFMIKTPAFSQQGISNRLRSISDSMYAQNNANYIVVDAIADGLIAPAQKYKVDYYNNTIFINDYKLDEAHRETYTKKYSTLLGKIGIGKDGIRFTASDGVSMSDIMNPQSAFRKEKNYLGVCVPKH